MITTDQIRENLNNTLKETDFEFGKKYTGKVRDNYILGGKRVIITTDRISCFDKVMGVIPFKGQILNQIAVFWFNKTKDIVDNHILSVPDPNVLVVKECRPYPVEIIVRAYLTGSLLRDYKAGKRNNYGFTLPDGLQKDQKFDSPILTPTTKAEYGEHDEPISKQDIIKKGLVSKEIYGEMENIAMNLFQRGTEHLAKNNLILVDTKYEFGEMDGKLVLMDEIHTPDSSRFWFADFYNERFHKGEDQKMLDKEYVRRWLIQEHNFMGDGPIPVLTDEVRIEASRRYIEALEQITGEDFRLEKGGILERIKRNIKEFL